MSQKQVKVRCRLCQGEFAKRGLSRHLSTCLQRAEARSGRVKRLFHLQVEGTHYPDYWLHLELPEDATFGALDEFLRGLWLDCCSHMSAFEFGDRKFWSVTVNPGFWDEDEDEDENIHDLPISEKLSSEMSFRYLYDFGSTTELSFRVIGVREGVPLEEPIALLARNEPLHIPCDYCKKRDAVEVCPVCRWDDKAWVCKACKKKHKCGEDIWLPVVDSPRVGECGYDGGEEEHIAIAMARRAMPSKSSAKTTKATKAATGIRATAATSGGVYDLSGPIIEQKGRYGQVQKQLRKHMGSGSDEDLDLALRIWQAYLEEKKPQVRSVGAYAAAVAYIVAIETDDYDTTQGDLAKRYKTTAGSVSRLYRDIGDTLGFVWEWEEGYEEGEEDESSALPAGLLSRPALSVPDEPVGLEEFKDMLQAMGLLADDEDEIEELYLDPSEESILRSLPLVKETWVGGCYALDVSVDAPFPMQPTVCLWTTPKGHPVVGKQLFFAENREDAAQELLDLLVCSMETPDMAAPGRRTRVQVADEAYVAPFQDALEPFGIDVSYGGVEVIQSICLSLEAAMQQEASPRTYEQRVRADVDEAMIATLFSASAVLYQRAPWQLLGDAQPLLVDLGAWDLGAYCVCVLGYGGMTEGILVFDDLDAFETFFQVAERADMSGIAPTDLGASIRAINFESLAELPVEFRRESMGHGWEMASADAYPHAQKIRQDMIELPLQAEDMTVLTACASAVAAYVEAHGGHVKLVNTHMADVDDRHVKLVSPLPMKTTLSSFPGRPAVEIVHPHPQRFARMKKKGYPMLS